MAARDRKRSSAFEDFPVENNSIDPAESAPAFLTRSPAASAPQMERIERLPPSQMLPDRFQPRRLLPPILRPDFYSGRIDCYRAAEEWLAISRTDPAVHAELEKLLAMGLSFEEHGQIKPITGSWVDTTDGRYVFLIETGERRFWAACLQTVANKMTEEPLLRVEVVMQPTRQRQVLENRHAENPSAVEQSCEVAALILAELGIHPDGNYEDEYEYFRQARAQRMPAGLWDRLIPIMQLTRPRMVQLLNILNLPSSLLDLADRYRLPERVLREVLSLPRENWERALRISIQNQLTSDEVAEMAAVHNEEPASDKRPASPRPDPSLQAMRYLRRFANLLDAMDEVSRAQALDDIADELVVNRNFRNGQMLLGLLDELAKSINARLSRMDPRR